MLRSFIALTVMLWVNLGSEVQSQNHRPHSHPPRWQSHASSSQLSPRLSLGAERYQRNDRGDIRNPYGYPFYGYGYIYDPYQTGSFRAPDLMNDPYFRDQHKFDSRYPGRYSRRPPLEFRHPAQVPR
ncbi:hypothetical protein Pla52o_36860 [Novipirellula galeiformis]|uniref:Uncharacterized protein n=1 Tax=Novipirellula galeiformis TaxID=2528004 RepID=A0A5C6CFH7_9BACT|nr:hypothetical protein [Novipirellula galeiformis]TWU21499.1 hypothetical protein Pla52o_36860 [Novipirellula galeiformis]